MKKGLRVFLEVIPSVFGNQVGDLVQMLRSVACQYDLFQQLKFGRAVAAR